MIETLSLPRIVRILPFLAGAVAALIGAPESHAADAADAERARALHVLERLGYGPRPGDVERVAAMGVERYIAQQLRPQGIAESPVLSRALAQRPSLDMGYAELFARYAAPALRERREAKREDGGKAAADKQAQREVRDVAREAMEARLLTALYSTRQLEAVMTEFWFDHFNVFVGKGLDRVWLAPYERETIRPRALGKFRDLLGATAHSPAMLFYLDNWQSSAAGTRRRGRAGGGLNENYARELMELHTLGVDGGYTQKDVTELARILTGWGFDRAELRDGRGDGFRFDARRHDTGDKLFLGRTYRDHGEAEGEAALDQLADDPATARHIARELAVFFVSDRPSDALVDTLARRFRATEGDIRAVLATLFASDEFWADASVGTKFKSPYRYVVSALRAADLRPDDFRPLLGELNQLGMPLYGCVTPDGYAHTEAAWLTPGALTARIDFATALGAGRLPPARGRPGKERLLDDDGPRGRTLASPDANGLLDTLAPRWRAATRAAQAQAPQALRAGLLLGSPEFQRY